MMEDKNVGLSKQGVRWQEGKGLMEDSPYKMSLALTILAQEMIIPHVHVTVSANNASTEFVPYKHRVGVRKAPLECHSPALHIMMTV